MNGYMNVKPLHS